MGTRDKNEPNEEDWLGEGEKEGEELEVETGVEGIDEMDGAKDAIPRMSICADAGEGGVAECGSLFGVCRCDGREKDSADPGERVCLCKQNSQASFCLSISSFLLRISSASQLFSSSHSAAPSTQSAAISANMPLFSSIASSAAPLTISTRLIIALTALNLRLTPSTSFRIK